MPVPTVTLSIDTPQITTGASASAELKYLIDGTDSETAAITALGDTAPVTYLGYVRQARVIEPIGDVTETLKWWGTMRYGNATFPATREEGESVVSFDTSGGTTHTQQSIDTVQSYAPSGTPPDFEGAINVSGSGSDQTVGGVDIVTPVYSFAETHYFAFADVDLAYRGTLFSLTGKVNNASFRGTSAGETLFLGASGSVRGQDNDWEITFRFAASPNQTGLTVGGITGIAKKGWEYLWVHYEQKTNGTGTNKTIVPSAKSVHVEQVYQSGDFSGLGLG